MRKAATTMFQFLLVLLVLLIATSPTFAQQLGQYPTHQYWAVDFAQWSIPGNGPNNFSFLPGQCIQSAPGVQTFQPFSKTPAGGFTPVYILDTASSGNSETVTPSSYTLTGSSCTVTMAPANTHYSFQVMSGTAGLQEALNTVGQNTQFASVVFLDKNWYTKVTAISGTASSILGSVVGTSNIAIVDETTQPFQAYTWNGATYVKSAVGASGLFYGQVPSALTLIAAPSAPTVAVAAGGALSTGSGGTYYVMQTCADALGGESLASTDSVQQTVTGGNQTLSVTAAACGAGSVGYRLWITAAGGSTGTEIAAAPTCTAAAIANGLANVCALTASASITANPSTTAKIPAQGTAHATAITAQSTYSAGFQQVFSPFTATGVETAATSYTLAQVQIPAAFFNTLLRRVRICGMFTETPVINSAPTYTITAANQFGQSPVTIASFVIPATTLTAVANQVEFCVNVTTAATGASGTLETHGNLVQAVTSTGAPYAGTNLVDGNTAVSSAIDLTKPIYLAVVSTPATANITQAQMRDLSIEVLK